MIDFLEDASPVHKFILIFPIAITFSVLVYTGLRDSANEFEIEKEMRATPAGDFALKTFEKCKSRGWFSSPADATCVDETIGIAQTLRGSAFSDEVKQALAQKLTPSSNR